MRRVPNNGDSEVLLWNATSCSPDNVVYSPQTQKLFMRCSLGSVRTLSSTVGGAAVLVPLPSSGSATAYPSGAFAYDSFAGRLLVGLGGFAVETGLYAINPSTYASQLLLADSECDIAAVHADPLTGHVYVSCLDPRDGSTGAPAVVAIQQGSGARVTVLTQENCASPTSVHVSDVGRVLATCAITIASPTSATVLVSAPRPIWPANAGGNTAGNADSSTGPARSTSTGSRSSSSGGGGGGDNINPSFTGSATTLGASCFALMALVTTAAGLAL